MAFTFDETCPCGGKVFISHSFEKTVEEQITEWRRIHTRHAHAIAKVLAAKGQIVVANTPEAQGMEGSAV